MLIILAATLIARSIWAGGSGYNVAVVVNLNSTNSMQLANAYCEARGVPPQNILRLNYQWSGGSISCSQDELQNQLLVPLLNTLQSRNLTNQIQFVLLSMDFPYRVSATNGENSSTSTIFYGFKPDTTPPPGLPGGCSVPDDSSNSFAFSEMPFSQAPPSSAPTNSFLAVMLTDSNLAGAELILDQAVTGDSTFPTQNVDLAKSSDPVRNVRFTEFDNAIFDARLRNDNSVLRTNTDSTAGTNLLGMETGLVNFSVPTNACIPGSIADNLTSFGGYIFENAGQTSLLAFLNGGAAGSYGTIAEPCNYPQKFPNPIDYFYQLRGFSLAESYYQSLSNPYQGLIVGEPLSAPFALRGTGTWLQPANDFAVLSGRANLLLQFSSAAPDLPLNQVDLFVDGTWFETLTNIPPTAGDRVAVVLDSFTNNYTVPANATVASLASNLATVLNAASNTTFIRAIPIGDRLELHSLEVGRPGSSIALQATGGSTTFVTAAQPTFLDTLAIGYHSLQVSNSPVVGDWLQLRVTKTNGAVLTVAVTNTSNGESIGQLVQSLLNAINGSASLQSPDGLYAADFYDGGTLATFNLYAQSPGWPPSGIQATLTSSPDLAVEPPGTRALQDNLSDLQPRNHLYVASGRLSLPVNWIFDTIQISDGYHELAAIAYEGTSVRTQTRTSRQVIVQNTSLAATLNTLFGGSNTDLSATLQFSVTASTSAVNTTELFSTGGSLGIATNESTAYFSVTGANLGIGLHPFYAIVTDTAGHQYRTATTWIRLIGAEPSFSTSATYPPLQLAWPATAGRSYDILLSTNIRGPFQNIATVIPSNSTALWVDTNSSASERFYRVQTSN